MPATEEALALKQKGNAAFAKHEWLVAVDFYTKAIDVYEEDSTFFCNRAAVGSVCPVEGDY